MIIKNYFHKKEFALGVVLKERLAASQKWPIYSKHELYIKQSYYLLYWCKKRQLPEDNYLKKYSD